MTKENQLSLTNDRIETLSSNPSSLVVSEEKAFETAAFLNVLPTELRTALEKRDHFDELVEVVLDLGRKPEARFINQFDFLSDKLVTDEELQFVVARVGEFDRDNRAGIEKTLHRISCIRNRHKEIVGVTCRIGRAIYGDIDLISDLLKKGKSILILGRPGVGKTTLLREASKFTSDTLRKRVIVVDTSNEIGGDGDTPHPGIGMSARRMQVPFDKEQHDVMIEAVENHNPEVIIIDEIGRTEEADACRTIAERGVCLLGTAHGYTLDNLIKNPTLVDLIGGIQCVTLSDEEAERRKTQKSVNERKSPPTFDILIELRERGQIAIYHNVAETVDKILRGFEIHAEIRKKNDDSDGVAYTSHDEVSGGERSSKNPAVTGKSTEKQVQLFVRGADISHVERAIKSLKLNMKVVDSIETATAGLFGGTTLRRDRVLAAKVREMNIPSYCTKSGTVTSIKESLEKIQHLLA